MKLELKVDEKARLLGLPVADLFQKRATYSSLILVPESFAEKNRIVCFEANDSVIKIATQEPESDLNIYFLEELKEKEDKKIEVYVASPEAIDYALEWYKDENINPEAIKKQEKKQEIVESNKRLKINQLESFSDIDQILDHAILNKASEVHIECLPEYARIFYHVNGLHEIAKIPEPSGAKLVNDLKKMAHLRTGHVHQKGDFFKLYKGIFYHIITTTFSMPVGIKVNIEINAIVNDRFNMSELGMQDETIHSLLKTLKTDNGLFLVTGPSGSGRTFTMYSILSLLMKKGKKVATIENTIDCFIDGFNQTEVRPHEGLTFKQSLKNISNQGYNAILLDGLRDSQTAALVDYEVSRDKIIVAPFSNKSVSEAVSHLEELGFSKENIAKNLRLVINQRLLLRLCSNCIVEKKMEDADKEVIKNEINNLLKQQNHSNIKLKQYMHNGCPSCSETGFSGHIGIFEVMPIDNDVREEILKGELATREKDLFKNKNLITLRQDGLIKVTEGVTTLDEVDRVS